MTLANGTRSPNDVALRETFLLFLLFLCLVSYTKGLNLEISKWGEPYGFINYSDGLIRRGLLGQLFSIAFDQKDVTRIRYASMSAHFISSVMLIVGLWLWMRKLYSTGWDLIPALFALFATSQFLPRLAYDTGFLDVYAYGLALIALVAFPFSMLIPSLIGLTGAFVHEVFLFLWPTVALLTLWQKVTTTRIAVLVLPVLAILVLYFGTSEHAAIAQMERAPLSADVKKFMLDYQFSQTLMPSLELQAWRIKHYYGNIIIAVTFFTFPAWVMIGTYALVRKSAIDTLVLLGAMLAPAATLIVVWDLSRFLCALPYSALLAVLFMQTIAPVQCTARRIVLPCYGLAGFMLLVPLVYAFFNVAAVIDRGVYPFSNTVIGSIASSIVQRYSWGADKFEPSDGDAPADVPGSVWLEEEDGWKGIWTRRPGTDVFDAVWTKGRATVRGVLTIQRIGKIIQISRQTLNGPQMTYKGRIDGPRVEGRYPGGIWVATIK